MNPGPTTRLRWTSLLMLVLAMSSGSGASAGTPLAADPAAAGRGVRAASSASVSPQPLAPDLGSTRSARESGDGLVESAPHDGLEPGTLGVCALSVDRGSVLRGWMGSAGTRAGGAKLSAARSLSVTMPTADFAPDLPPSMRLFVGSELSRGGASSAGMSRVGLNPANRGARLAAGRDDLSLWGQLAVLAGSRSGEGTRSARNPGDAGGLVRPDESSAAFEGPSRRPNVPSRSPWSLRRDVEDRGHAADPELPAFQSLRTSTRVPALPRQSLERERGADLGAPLGYEVLELAFGSEDGMPIQPFVAGRRQDPDASCSAFGREVLGTAGLQFAAGEAWRCRVQVSQSFVDDVKERFEKPAFSVSLRRRF